MLHIINSFPITSSVFEHTHSGDTVIFTDNAVLAVKQENFDSTTFAQKTFSHINLCVRKADLLIRNISNTDLLSNVVIIDDMQYEFALSQSFAIKSCN